ncbi:MAG: beta-N-acetylhexosaminidase [Clostridia bacterium]|nr:beta-N-acetylhexosaminidase [Clostridia bacterium]
MQYNIIPVPYSISRYQGKGAEPCAGYSFAGEEDINCETDLKDFFCRVFKNESAVNKDKKLDIILELSDMSGDEAYRIAVDGAVTINARSSKGFFYAVQTLKQLILEFWLRQNTAIPSIVIEDKPLYLYRGYMLDVSRHFFDADTVIELLSVLALHKINKFHFHITDDQGWRVEIKQYPRLTEIGATRKGTLGNKIPHGGYYTQEDIKKIVAYASSKHIEVIPEIDLPGHFTAAIAAYPELSCEGKAVEVATSFGIKHDIACCGKESTFTFFEKVIDEITEIFPSSYIHIGGDEAPKDRWEECPACREKMQKLNLNSVEKLQGHMVNRIAEYIESKGRKAIVWNESLNSGILNDSIICQYWSDGKEPLRVLNGINSGRNTIISKFTPYYFDYPHGMHSLKAIYTFEPELKGAEGNESNIIGIEGHLWTEYVETKAQINYQTFPRLTALSEIAWSSKAQRNYDDFEERLKEFYPIYELYGITPTPIADVNPGKIAGTIQIIKFFKNAITRESIKSFFSSYKANKKVKSTRNEDKN